MSQEGNKQVIESTLGPLIAQSPLPSVVTDADGKICARNRSFEVLFEGRETLHSFSDCLSSRSSEYFSEIFRPLLNESHRLKNVPLALNVGANKTCNVLASSHKLDCASETLFLTTLTDVTPLVVDRKVHKFEFPLNLNQLTQRLVAMRKSFGQSQDKIAAHLGLSLRTYQRIEHGETSLSIDQLLKLCEKFGMAPSSFLIDDIHDRISEHRARLLLVEDDNDVATILTEKLEGWGFEVVRGENGREAFEFLKQQHFDVVISDLKMPKMDGYQFIKKINSISLKASPEVYIVTGSAGEEVSKKVDLPIERVLTKPIDYEALKRVLFKRYVP